MKRNNQVHHKKNSKKSVKNSKQNPQAKQPPLQNPESSAKFCLLQISEESLKTNNRTFTAFEGVHSRSYSTEFFNKTKSPNKNGFSSNEEENSLSLNKYLSNRQELIQQSVTLKSTFSNEMRKTLHNNTGRRANWYSSNEIKQKSGSVQQRSESLRKIRRINYVPFTVQQEKQIQKIDQIFRSTPSKQILAILKRTKLTKEASEDGSNNLNQKSQNDLSSKKRSIFNIRHLMIKDKFEEQNSRKRKQSPQKQTQSPDILQAKQLHSNGHGVVKMRLRNRFVQSNLVKR